MMLATIVGAATVKSLLDHCTQHLLYIGTDGDIYEIAWKKPGWHSYNVSKLSKCPKAECDLAGYSSTTGADYIYYYTQNKHIYQLYRANPMSKWVVTDISVASQLNVEPEGTIIVWPLLGTEHLYFRDKKGHIHELYRVLLTWKHNNLSLQACAPLAETCYRTPQVPSDIDDDINSSNESLTESDFLDYEDDQQFLYPQLYQGLYPTSQVCIYSYTTSIKSTDFVSMQLQSGKSLDKLQSTYAALSTQEKILQDNLRNLRSGGQVASTEEQLETTLKTVQQDQKSVRKMITEQLKKRGLISGNIFGHATLTSQYIFYVGIDGSLHLLRYAPPLFGEIKRSSQTVDTWVPPSSPPQQSTDSWWSATKKMVKTAYDYVSTTAASTFPTWTRSNLFELTHFNDTQCVGIVGEPASHYTISGSQHLFFIDYPQFHLHEFVWSTSAANWEHRDLTALTECPPCSPTGRLTSYVTNTLHCVYFIDQSGSIHELRQNLLGGPWLKCNLHTQISELPAATEIFASATLPMNRDTNAVVMDKAGHIIELGCRFAVTSSICKWSFLDLSVDKRLVSVSCPRGAVLVYTKGLVESMSLLTVETVSSACSAAYNIAKSMSPLGVSHGQTSSASQQVETEDFEQLYSEEGSLALQLQRRLQMETKRLRDQSEATEKLQLRVIEMQQEHEKLTTKQKQDNVLFAETEQIKQQHLQQLEEVQKQLMAKEQEMLESKRKIEQFEQELAQKELDREKLRQEAAEREQQLAREAQKLKVEREQLENEKKEKDVQVHLKTNEDDDKECIVCMDSVPQVRTEPCNHKVLCKQCMETRLRKKECPKCTTPIVNAIVD